MRRDQRERALFKQADRITRFYFERGYWMGLSDSDLKSRITSVRSFLNTSPLRFRLTYRFCILILDISSVLLDGRTFNRLSGTQKKEVMDRLLISRKRPICSVPVFLSLPYFKGDQVSKNE